MSKILIAGVNGFVGKHLIEYLKKQHTIVGIYNHNQNNIHKDIKNISVNDIFKINNDFDYVFLLNASIITNKILSEKDRDNLFINNVVATNSFCEYFLKSRIIYCSSVSVYANSKEKITEKHPVGMQNEYGISKLWAEHIVKKCPDYAIVRYSSIYGTGMKTNIFLPNSIIQAVKYKEIIIYGNGERCQDYIHVSDAVRFLISAANCQNNDTFLGVSGKSYSNVEVAKIISRITGCGITFKGDDNSPSYIYNNDYTCNVLSCKAEIDINDGIKELIEWIR